MISNLLIGGVAAVALGYVVDFIFFRDARKLRTFAAREAVEAAKDVLAEHEQDEAAAKSAVDASRKQRAELKGKQKAERKKLAADADRDVGKALDEEMKR